MAPRYSYAAYKDTGIDWIPGLPSHWGLSRLAHCVRLVREKQVPNNGDLYVGLENVSSWTGELIPREDGEVEGGSTKMPAGAVLFGKLRPYLAKSYLAERDGWCSSEFLVMLPQKLHGQYLHYLTLSRGFVETVAGSTYGAKMPRANWEYVGKLKIPVPSWDEQQAIARFLDHETARIDALIVQQERLIELLQEKRQAVITHAVTGELDSTRPTKDGGSEWLPRIPVGWELPALSAITNKITNGYVGPTRDVLVDDGVRYLQSTHVKRNAINFSVPYFVPLAWSEQHRKSILKEGDVLIVQTGDIGQVAVVPAEFEGANCHALIIASPTKAIRGRFLSWVLNSDYGYHSLKSLQTGALHPHLNCDAVKTIKVPVPPLMEQDQIVRYIDGELESIERAGSRAQQMIDLLHERRAAIISAAVTGGIDVRGWESEAAGNQEMALGD